MVFFVRAFMRVRVFAHPDWPIVPPLTQWTSLRPSCQHGRTRCQDWRADCGLVALLCRVPLRYLPLFSESFPKNADRKKSCCDIHRFFQKIREQGYKRQREIYSILDLSFIGWFLCSRTDLYIAHCVSIFFVRTAVDANIIQVSILFVSYL